MGNSLFNTLNTLAIMDAIQDTHRLERENEELKEIKKEIDAENRQLEQFILQHSQQQPVGCCPKCHIFWYTYENFCGGCGFKRIDF